MDFVAAVLNPPVICNVRPLKDNKASNRFEI